MQTAAVLLLGCGDTGDAGEAECTESVRSPSEDDVLFGLSVFDYILLLEHPRSGALAWLGDDETAFDVQPETGQPDLAVGLSVQEFRFVSGQASRPGTVCDRIEVDVLLDVTTSDGGLSDEFFATGLVLADGLRIFVDLERTPLEGGFDVAFRNRDVWDSTTVALGLNPARESA